MGKKIAVGFGHMLNCDQGATGKINEYDFNRQYGPHVISWLQKDGNEVLNVTPSSATSMSNSLYQRVKKANDWHADIFISCHGNAFNGSAHGCEAVVGGSAGMTIGNRVCTALGNAGFTNRKAYMDVRGLYEINHTTMPAIIIEPIFVDNVGDIALYRKIGISNFAKIIAEAIVGHAISGTGSVIPAPSAPIKVNTPTVITSKSIVSLNKELQVLLNSHGIYGNNGRALWVDGIPGTQTLSAIQKIHAYPGERGTVIAWVQKRLNIHVDGYYADPRKTKYHETYDAVCSFQRSHGLTVDGYAGPLTITQMVK